MMNISIKDEYIRLGQAMKLAGLVQSGIEAKIFIGDGEVQVNGEVEVRRGRKLREGDQFTFQGQTVHVHSIAQAE